MSRTLLTALMKLELPGHIVRLCDGGSVPWAGETFIARDPLLGGPSGFESLTEGVGDEAPAGAITFLPPDEAPAAQLNAAANQGARLRLWIAEVDPATGAVTGAPEQLCDWIVDTTRLIVGQGKRELEIVFVSGGERIFQRNRGNLLSPAHHRSIYPGEAGLDGASGVPTSVPWGVASPPRGVTGG